MDATFHALGRILLNAVPTFLILLFLVVYLRWMFFSPLQRVFERRYDATEGARKAADESMRQAEVRIAEYEAKLRDARGEIYAEQEKIFKQVEQENAARIEGARREAEGQIALARVDLEKQAAEARRSLDAQSEDLADRIVSRVLEGRAA